MVQKIIIVKITTKNNIANEESFPYHKKMNPAKKSDPYKLPRYKIILFLTKKN